MWASSGKYINIYMRITFQYSDLFLLEVSFSGVLLCYSVFIGFYDENNERKKIMAKEKNGRDFHLYENELNSLKKDTEMLAITK